MSQGTEEQRGLTVGAPTGDATRVILAVLRGVLMAGLLVATGAISVLLLGAYLPGLPVLGVLGSFAAGWSPRIAVASLLFTAVALALLLRRPTWPRRIIVALAVLGLAGSGVITARWVAVGSANGVRVDPFAAAPADAEADRSVVYDQHDGADLRLHIWEPEASSTPAPVAVVVHGGGWIGGAPTDNSGTKRWYADQGWLVLSVEYPLSGPERHLWEVTDRHIGCALVWAGAHVSQMGGDPERIVLMGDSAGGNLALVAALKSASGQLDPTCPGQVPDVAAVAVLYPAVDPAGFYGELDPLLNSTAQRMVGGYTGGAPSEVPDRYRAISPATYLTDQAPPILILHGSNDHLLPAQSSREFTAQAREVGLDVRLVEVPHVDHVFDATPAGSDLARKVTEHWLDGQGLAPAG